MASTQVVERVLKSIAAMFGKHPLWVEDSIKMWELQLEDIDDRDLIIGCKDLLRKTKKLPTVAQLRDVIIANPSTKAGDPVIIEGCPACQGTGQRQMARWYVNDQGKLKVYNCNAACDCAKGLRLAMGAFVLWSDAVAGWERNPATTQVYYGTRDQPVLTRDQTMTAEDRQRMEDRKNAVV
tara:strand:+ start:814 stop:1356 length:543 start_codon:yes stop_codon:yes gene_type:complete